MDAEIEALICRLRAGIRGGDRGGCCWSPAAEGLLPPNL